MTSDCSMARKVSCAVLGLALMGAGACGGRLPPVENPPPPVEKRIPNSPPEKLADMPAPYPEADPANKDETWGHESAKVRRDAARQSAARRGCVNVIQGQTPPPGSVPCPPPPKQ
jgi:hypothetical protein